MKCSGCGEEGAQHYVHGYLCQSMAGQKLEARAEAAEKEVARLKYYEAAWTDWLSLQHGDIQALVKEAPTLKAECDRLRTALTEVSGCETVHGTPKLCAGCLMTIQQALGVKT